MNYEDINTHLADILARYDADQIVYICDSNIDYKSSAPMMMIESSEADKSIQTVMRIWDFLFEHSITRSGVIVAIGGGVITDMAGFAAGTYKRGIDYINIPTTLLAMVDASSGGKTGFNYRGLKNSIGLFAPPVETIIIPEVLATLPAKQWLNGFAEMLKIGLIDDRHKLWYELMQYDLDTMPIEGIRPLIEQCLDIKQRIVDTDPKERGIRKVLNLGHSFGHALEEIKLGAMPHGYAVLYGLIAELYLSVTKIGCPADMLQQLTQVMNHYYGKPQCRCSDRNKLIELMMQDKKNERAHQINCTLISDIGQPIVNQTISVEEANEAWEYLFSL